MKRIGIVLTVGFGTLFVASSATAEQPAVAPPPTPVVTAGPTTTEVVTMSSAPARRGLFLRLRNRRAMMTTMPVVSTGSMSTPMPMPVPSAVVPAPVMPAAGIVMEEESGIVMTGYSEVQPVRRGLFARLRMRR